jgi:psp operon transcriptional activator
VQERLLRVVEYGRFERLGGSATVQVDVRLIGATNVDLPSEAAAGRFREDLLDRLAFDVLTVPPLRARREDIPLLAEHFGRAMAHDLGWPVFAGFAADALDALLAHPWPGNVRELKNVVERAVYRAGSPGRRITAVQFDPFASPFRPAAAQAQPARSRRISDRPKRDNGAIDQKPDGAIDFRQAVAAFERQLLEDTLAAHRHNQRATAGALGLTYDQLRNQLRKHGLLPARR